MRDLARVVFPVMRNAWQLNEQMQGLAREITDLRRLLKVKMHTLQTLELLGAPWHAVGCCVINKRGSRLSDLTSYPLGLKETEAQTAARVMAAAPELYKVACMLASLPRDNRFVREYEGHFDLLREAICKAEGRTDELQSE